MRNFFSISPIKSSFGMTSVLAMTVLAAPAQAAIAPFSASYDFSVDKYNGVATRTLSRRADANEWQYTVSAGVGRVASAGQAAIFQDVNGTIYPIATSRQYKIFGVGNTTTFAFDNANQQYTSTYKGRNHTISMPQTALDDLGLEMQIREDLKAGRFRGTYLMAGRDSVESVPFTKSAPMSVTVPAGTFNVIRIDRIHNDEERRTSFWLAPSLDYLPVQVIQNSDGKTIQMSLTKINR